MKCFILLIFSLAVTTYASEVKTINLDCRLDSQKFCKDFSEDKKGKKKCLKAQKKQLSKECLEHLNLNDE